MAQRERITWCPATGNDALDDLIEQNVKDAVREYLKDQYGYFPNLYYPRDGSRRKKKPPLAALTFRVYLEEGVLAEKDFDLEELLIEEFSDCYVDGSYLEGLRRIAAALAKISALADAVIKIRDAAGKEARFDLGPNGIRDLAKGK